MEFTLHFQISSSYVNIEMKSETTPFVVVDCIFWHWHSCLFMFTLHFQIISSYVDVRMKSVTTQYVVPDCTFWHQHQLLFLRTLCFLIMSSYVKVPKMSWTTHSQHVRKPVVSDKGSIHYLWLCNTVPFRQPYLLRCHTIETVNRHGMRHCCRLSQWCFAYLIPLSYPPN